MYYFKTSRTWFWSQEFPESYTDGVEFQVAFLANYSKISDNNTADNIYF